MSDPCVLLIEENVWVFRSFQMFIFDFSAALDQPEIWGSAQPINTNVESPKLPRPFPTGSK